ncbi:MAG: hypothetical protein MZU97_01455 [Bacillus subtilis]|nr:hypothetical protein [Bacillus subtilis]
MNVWLDTGLKTFVSVLILYLAVNSFWRYHPIAKARHVATLGVVSDPDHGLPTTAARPLVPPVVFWASELLIEAVWYVLRTDIEPLGRLHPVSDRSRRTKVRSEDVLRKRG